MEVRTLPTRICRQGTKIIHPMQKVIPDYENQLRESNDEMLSVDVVMIANRQPLTFDDVTIGSSLEPNARGPFVPDVSFPNMDAPMKRVNTGSRTTLTGSK